MTAQILSPLATAKDAIEQIYREMIEYNFLR
jgi:hypothetical protein